ncbi:MAG TPA: molybdate ABC transporter substrate-binding protein [Gaiellaceae bacterium]|nr:molybdate ABC transporter substrate-binding protein [Gaiellaceae bacterium]
MRLCGALLLALLLAGCGGASGAAGPRLTVLAASSLTDVLPRIDPEARYSFGGSDELAFQVEQGAPADVYLAASPTYPAELHAKGLVERPRVFATNELVLVVPRANPAGIKSVRDLGRGSPRVVVAAQGVPAGDYARRALAKLGLERVVATAVSQEPDVRSVLAKVALGEADAGVVYRSDAAAAKGKVRAIALPRAAEPSVEYELAVVSASGRRDAAEAFVRRVLGPDGRRELRRAGFGVPPRQGDR